MSKLKLSVSGARGIVGRSLTPEVTTRLSAAFSSVRGGRPILIGGDTRITGPMVTHSVVAGVTAAGSPVLNCGICPTPSLLIAVNRRDDIGGGILVTASHNPIEWNALKFINQKGFFLDPKEGEELKRLFEGDSNLYLPWDRVGSIDDGPDIVEEHIREVLDCSLIDVESIRARNFHVALDGTGGAGSSAALELLNRLGCRVTAIHCSPDGTFPRPPEPKPENLGDLSETVRQSGSSIGFALDPDGDRLSLVDENGRPLVEEATLALVVDYLLPRKKGPVVINLSTSRMVEDIAVRECVPFHRTPVGEAHVAAKMIETGAVVGGEGNGGVMLSDIHPARDSLVGIALLLQAMADSESSVAKMVGRLPQYEILKSVVSADSFDEERLLARMGETFGEFAIDRRDGIHLAWKERWAHIRASNTEPVVRIVVEAPDCAGAEALRHAAASALGDSGQQPQQ